MAGSGAGSMAALHSASMQGKLHAVRALLAAGQFHIADDRDAVWFAAV